MTALLSIGALVVGVTAVFAVIRRMRGWTPGWATSATENLTLPVTMDVALRRAETAFAKLPLKGSPERAADGRTVSATVRGNWMTYGNSVDVSVRPGQGEVEVVVSSRPVTPQLFDWGAESPP